jgi:hypothetical protein
LLLVVGAILAAPRLNEIFYVSIRAGRVLVVRGRLPAWLSSAFADIASDARVRRGSLRALRGPTHSRLVIRGVDGATEQRFRNAFGATPLKNLTRAAAADDQNLGQILGIAWLAWLLLRGCR